MDVSLLTRLGCTDGVLFRHMRHVELSVRVSGRKCLSRQVAGWIWRSGEGSGKGISLGSHQHLRSTKAMENGEWEEGLGWMHPVVT